MITTEQIKQIIATGEGYNAEFKETIPSKTSELSREICAFANTTGGILLIGVDDDNEIQGVELDNRTRSRIHQSIGEISPELTTFRVYEVDVDGKNIVVIEVDASAQRPHFYSGAAYVRSGPNTEKITSADRLRDLFQTSTRVYFDELPCPQFSVRKHLDPEMFKLFRGIAAISPGVSDDQVMDNLRLKSTDGSVKAGAVLFFGKNPEALFEQCGIHCVRFNGTDKRHIEDSKLYQGPLYLQFRLAMQWIRQYMNIKYEIETEGSGPRKEVWGIPETVFREALINALSHRDYYEQGAHITMECFDDRVEISNPGGLVSSIPPREFGKRSLSRNPLIFGLFERMRMVERIGSGIIRMRELMEEAGLSAPEFQLEGMFVVTLQRPVNIQQWLQAWESHLTDTRVRLLNLLANDPKLSTRMLSKELKISNTAVSNNIDFLKQRGLLSRVGPERTGFWKVHYIYPDDQGRRRK